MDWSRSVAEKFMEFGGHLILETRVEKIRVKNGKVTGVTVAGPDGGQKEFKGARVVSNIPAQQTFNVIDKQYFPQQWVEKTEKMYGYGSYTPYMGLNRLVMPEDEAKLGLKNTCVISGSEGFDYDVYICWNIQSAVDTSSAPAEKHLYTAYLPLTEEESLNHRLVDKLIRRLPEFMEGTKSRT